MTIASNRAYAAPVPDVRGLRIPERTLELIRELVVAHLGIYYDDGRLDILRDRIVPLAIERGFDSLLDYYYLLKYDAAAGTEWPRVMDALSVQETYFWRETDHFTALARAIVPGLIGRLKRRIRIWSIPCASGEEPLSIAIALNEAGLFDAADIEIHASDASEAALAKARGRRYGRRAFRQLPDALREKYFTRVPDREEWMVGADLYSRIDSWTRINIVNPDEIAALASSDVIFCRNLFIYFTPAGVRTVACELARHMPSPGYLCVGAAESLLKAGAGFDLLEVGGAYVYVKQ
ncbi:MAG: protein-glutamate O-methyltransferase CheR [Cyanobacteria bacterium]|nr:protein-glutamate O-methyltransferase CheR [Cyanobacteriota bacterium]